MDFEKKRHLFHMLAGTFLGGKTYSEYCFFLLNAMEEAEKEGRVAKGFKTLRAFTKENHERAEKHMKLIEDFLKKEPSTLGIALDEIDKIEGIMALIIELSPNGQSRVKGLVEKIKKDQTEIDYWNDIKKEYESNL